MTEIKEPRQNSEHRTSVIGHRLLILGQIKRIKLMTEIKQSRQNSEHQTSGIGNRLLNI